MTWGEASPSKTFVPSWFWALEVLDHVELFTGVVRGDPDHVRELRMQHVPMAFIEGFSPRTPSDRQMEVLQAHVACKFVRSLEESPAYSPTLLGGVDLEPFDGGPMPEEVPGTPFEEEEPHRDLFGKRNDEVVISGLHPAEGFRCQWLDVFHGDGGNESDRTTGVRHVGPDLGQ